MTTLIQFKLSQHFFYIIPVALFYSIFQCVVGVALFSSAGPRSPLTFVAGEEGFGIRRAWELMPLVVQWEGHCCWVSQGIFHITLAENSSHLLFIAFLLNLLRVVLEEKKSSYHSRWFASSLSQLLTQQPWPCPIGTGQWCVCCPRIHRIGPRHQHSTLISNASDSSIFIWPSQSRPSIPSFTPAMRMFWHWEKPSNTVIFSFSILFCLARSFTTGALFTASSSSFDILDSAAQAFRCFGHCLNSPFFPRDIRH